MEAADLITCVSKHERDMLVSEIGLKARQHQDNLQWYKLGRLVLCLTKKYLGKQYPTISEKFVLFAGRLATNKGLSDLISAMQLIDKKSVDLVITGADMGLGKVGKRSF